MCVHRVMKLPLRLGASQDILACQVLRELIGPRPFRMAEQRNRRRFMQVMEDRWGLTSCQGGETEDGEFEVGWGEGE